MTDITVRDLLLQTSSEMNKHQQKRYIKNLENNNFSTIESMRGLSEQDFDNLRLPPFLIK